MSVTDILKRITFVKTLVNSETIAGVFEKKNVYCNCSINPYTTNNSEVPSIPQELPL